MATLFKIDFLEEAILFLESLDIKHSGKILYNIERAQNEQDSELFKKLKDDIWEFRTLYQGHQYRLLAFWDKKEAIETFVISTHGFVKKQSKVPEKEIERAKYLRKQYFDAKEKIKKK